MSYSVVLIFHEETSLVLVFLNTQVHRSTRLILMNLFFFKACRAFEPIMLLEAIFKSNASSLIHGKDFAMVTYHILCHFTKCILIFSTKSGVEMA